jgi:hypothetical protein
LPTISFFLLVLLLVSWGIPSGGTTSQRVVDWNGHDDAGRFSETKRITLVK